MITRTLFAAAVMILPLFAQHAMADDIFVADVNGNVGLYNTSTNLGSSVGSLTASGFTPQQVIGIAYNPATSSIYIFDRNAATVYTMNPTTGVATILMSNLGFIFQGGAVANNRLYGIDEGAQTVVAFDLPGLTNSNLNPSSLPVHSHAFGVNPSTGQLYSADNSSSGNIYLVAADGNAGANVVAYNGVGNEVNDIEAFQGNFLVASFSNELFSIDGVTGAASVFLDSTQLGSMGVTDSLTGVALVAAVPEPTTWALIGIVTVGTGAVAWRKRRQLVRNSFKRVK